MSLVSSPYFYPKVLPGIALRTFILIFILAATVYVYLMKDSWLSNTGNLTRYIVYEYDPYQPHLICLSCEDHCY